MAVNYATNNVTLEEHTGTAVPTLAQGPGADRFHGLIDQTDVFRFMTLALDSSSPW